MSFWRPPTILVEIGGQIRLYHCGGNIMSIFARYKGLSGLLFAAGLGSTAAIAAGPIGELTPLAVDFNDKIPGQKLGTGGAAFAEPIDLDGLYTLIVEAGPGENFLQVQKKPGPNYLQALSWEFENSAELREGLISISMDFTASAMDRYTLDVREQGGGTKNFVSLTFASNGDLVVNDAAGYIGAYSNVYNTGDTLRIELLFDMDARTSSLAINGNTLFAARAHGINGRGVGKLMIGYDSITNGSAFALDNLLVLANVPLPLVLDADFNNKKPDRPIKSGGAVVGEPAYFASTNDQRVISIATNDLALQLWNPRRDFAQFALWELWKGMEVDSGIIVIEMDVRFQASQSYEISVNGPPNTGTLFTSIRFSPDRFHPTQGNIDIIDSRGHTKSLGSFQTNVFQRLRIAFDMDAGTYTVKLDGNALVTNRPHDVASGVGIASLQTGFQHGLLPGIPLDIDNLQVGVSDSQFVP